MNKKIILLKKNFLKKAKIASILVLATLMLSTLSTIGLIGVTNAQDPGPTLDPLSIPKYTNQLVIPPTYVPKMTYDKETGKRTQEYTVYMNEFYEQILPTIDENGDPTGFDQTLVWGYGGEARDTVTSKKLGFFQNSPGATFEATRGVPIRVKYVNNITSNHMFAVDPTLHWANPNGMTAPTFPFISFPPGYEDAQSNVPLVTHLHGGEVKSTSDGHPESWYTASGDQGPAYNTEMTTSDNSAVFYYPNEQLPTTLWYHDHSLGVTRTNVMAGLAGFYLLREKGDSMTPYVPPQKWEIPIVIQDRSFNLDGSMWFPTEGNKPDVHPYWNPEFFGNTIMVNGKLWPNLDVDRGVYRFRLLDGSNARFYDLTLDILDENGESTDDTLPFTQIGSDGGYLKSAARLDSLVIAPGERLDVLVDFSGLAPGTKVIMRNSAATPFPNGDSIEEDDPTGEIMQFTCKKNKGYPAKALPEILNPTLAGDYPTLPETELTRTLPFFEAFEDDEPVGVFLNGQKWDGVLTEMPQVGSTEEWYLVNPTEDAHPIHTHLTQFQVLYRVDFDGETYRADWEDLNGLVPVPLDKIPDELLVDTYLTGPEEVPEPNEIGWKDTIIAYPGTVTVIRIRFAPQSAPTTGPDAPTAGENLFPFDPTVGPGYVWHCHILDHEDNEMMRPYVVSP